MGWVDVIWANCVPSPHGLILEPMPELRCVVSLGMILPGAQCQAERQRGDKPRELVSGKRCTEHHHK